MEIARLRLELQAKIEELDSVLIRMEESGLHADRQTELRRVSDGLAGIIAQLESLSAFVAAPRGNDFAKKSDCGLHEPVRRAGMNNGTSSLRILIADDSAMNRLVLSRQLQILGYECDAAANGADALAFWCRNDYAAVLTDIDMPRMDGFELAKAIRGGETGGVRVPVLALTASGHDDEFERSRQAGIDELLGKPLRIEKLEALLQLWLHGRRVESDRQAGPDFDEALRELPIDISVLSAIVGDEPDTIREFLDEYYKSATKTYAELSTAYEKEDWAQFRKHIHALKSTSKTVGAKQVGELCLLLETALKETNLALLHESLPALDHAMEQVFCLILEEGSHLGTSDRSSMALSG